MNFGPCNFENTLLFIYLPPLSSALCSQVDDLIGDPGWLRDWNYLFSYVACLIGNVEKLKGGNKNCWQKKGKKVMLSMLLTHIHLYSHIFGVLQNTVIPSGTAFSRRLTQQLMVLKLEWNISKLLLCLTVKSGRWQSTWLMHIIYCQALETFS